jgi:glutamine synthetase
MICDVYKGFGGGRFSRDPRYAAQRAEEYLRTLGYDVSYWGPEIEFFCLRQSPLGSDFAVRRG